MKDDQSCLSIPISAKEIRLLIRRANKIIRDLDEIPSYDEVIKKDPEVIGKLSDLIHLKAVQRIDSSICTNDVTEEDPSDILNELI